MTEVLNSLIISLDTNQNISNLSSSFDVPMDNKSKNDNEKHNKI